MTSISLFTFHALEKEMATHSSVLAWRIPVTAEPSGLPSMGSHRVGHNSSDLAAAATTEKICILTDPKRSGHDMLRGGGHSGKHQGQSGGREMGEHR